MAKPRAVIGFRGTRCGGWGAAVRDGLFARCSKNPPSSTVGSGSRATYAAERRRAPANDASCNRVRQAWVGGGQTSLNLNDPVIRVLVWIVAIAVAVRLIYELLAPVAPWLLAALVLLGLARLVSWYRGRW